MRRRAAESGDLLLPILERVMELESATGPTNPEDIRFMEMLMYARALPRRDKVFSPSQLGSCMRQVYYARKGVEKHRLGDAQSHGYFLNGNFVHFKWQFAMWVAHQEGLLELARVPIGHEIDIVMQLVIDGVVSEKEGRRWMHALNFYGDATRPGVEVRVVDGDWGGTIDVLPYLTNQRTASEPYIVDFKGLRLDEWLRTVKKGPSQEYRKQIVGYGKLANNGLHLNPPIEKCLLVSECKAGPVSGVASPLALHESVVEISEFEGEVNRRLRTVRHHQHIDKEPPIECVSTLHMGFQSCPFNRFCRDEVLQVQRHKERLARQRYSSKKLSPKRSRREN